jgi:hypothetical protein
MSIFGSSSPVKNRAETSRETIKGQHLHRHMRHLIVGYGRWQCINRIVGTGWERDSGLSPVLVPESKVQNPGSCHVQIAAHIEPGDRDRYQTEDGAEIQVNRGCAKATAALGYAESSHSDKHVRFLRRSD